MLTAQWFGECAVRSGNAELLALGKPLALLAYLEGQRNRSASRTSLVQLLWSDVPETDGRQSLRQTVYYLKGKLGVEIIDSVAERLVLRDDLRSDRGGFEEAVRRRQWAEAFQFYQGGYLRAFSAPGAADFERWAAAERRRLARMLLSVAEGLAKELMATGHARAATDVAQRARDELRDEQAAWRLLLESRVSAKEYMAAVADAEALEQQLRDDGEQPEPATLVLLKTIRLAIADQSRTQGGTHRPNTSVGSSFARDLIGREREFSMVVEHWERVRSGSSGAWLHFEAPPGFGKTRLLHDVGARLRAMRANLVEIRAHAGEQKVSYAVAAHLAAALAPRRGARAISPADARIIVGLAPSASAFLAVESIDLTNGEEGMRRRAMALSELLSAVAQENALALVLDDLHWADSSSRQVLLSLMPRATELGILIVTTARTGQLGNIATEPTRTARLAGFSADDIVRLLSGVANVPIEGEIADLASLLERSSGGSPLLVIESIQRAMDASLINVVNGEWTASNVTALRSAIDDASAIQYRVAQLDADGRHVLGALAVARIPLSQAVLAGCLALRNAPVAALGVETPTPEADLGGGDVPALETLERKGMALRRGDVWDVAHDEIANAWQETATSVELRAMHSSLAASMVWYGERSASTIGQAISHFVNAESSPPSWLVKRLVDGARSRGDLRDATAILSSMLGAETAQLVRERVPDAFRRFRVHRWVVAASAMAAFVAIVAGSAWKERAHRARIRRAQVLLVSVADSAGERLLRYVFEDESDPSVTPVQGEGITVDDFPIAASLLGQSKGSGFRADGSRLLQIDPDANPKELTLPDIELISANGERRRLDPDTTDDAVPSWARGGESVLFAARRWSPPRTNELQIAWAARVGDSARQLTKTPGDKLFPRESPDGSRFLYTWSRIDGEPSALCWQPIPGRAASSGCVNSSLGAILASEGAVWTGLDEVVLQVDAGARGVLVVKMNTSTGSDTELARLSAVDRVSLNGRWVAHVTRNVDGNSELNVADLTKAAGTFHRLSLPKSVKLERLTWDGAYNAPMPVDSLAVSLGSRRLTVSHPTQIAVTGRWLGRRITVPASVLAIDGPNIGIDTDSGLTITPAVVGTWPLAVAFNVARVTLQLTVAADSGVRDEALMTWTESFRHDWLVRGAPFPTVTASGATAAALVFDGDGNNSTELVSRWSAAPDSIGAFGFEVTATVEPEFTTYDLLAVLLRSLPDTNDLSAWREGEELPHRQTRRVEMITAGLQLLAPGGPRIAVGAPNGQPLTSPVLRGNTRSVSVTLQVFADGAVRAALDGRPLVGIVGRLSTQHPIRLVLVGNAPKRNIRVGPVRRWRGVDRRFRDER